MRPAAAAFSEMRPSCGLRRSAMSSFASTFRRVVTPAVSRFGIRWISWSTPSMRKRTTSASSCGSKWMSLAPSSAAWKMIELTSRTSGASEMPSSTSRSSSSSSSSSSSRLAPRRRARAEGLRRRGRAAGSRSRMSSRGRDARARAGSRVASRSSSIAWMFCRVGDRDAAGRRPSSAYGMRGDALEDVQRDRACAASGSTPRDGEVDERQLVPRGEHARDAVARGEPLVERAPARTSRRCAARPRTSASWSAREQAGRARSGRRRARRAR